MIILKTTPGEKMFDFIGEQTANFLGKLITCDICKSFLYFDEFKYSSHTPF